MNKFVSMHIPKTGGTVFVRMILRSLYNDISMDYHGGFYNIYNNTKRDENLKHDIIHGHFATRKYKDRPIITWVRDPIKRAISQFYADIKRPRSIENGNVMTKYFDGYSFDDFAFIGVLERFKESIIRLENVLNKDLSKFKTDKFEKKVKEMYSTNERTVDYKILSQIFLNNKKDIELYSEITNKLGYKIYGIYETC